MMLRELLTWMQTFNALFHPYRMAVAAVFPMFMASVVIIRSVILFRRGTIRDKEVRAAAMPEHCLPQTLPFQWT